MDHSGKGSLGMMYQSPISLKFDLGTDLKNLLYRNKVDLKIWAVKCVA